MAKKFKEIDHNIDVKGLVIHQVIKSKGDRNTGLNMAPNAIPVTANEKRTDYNCICIEEREPKCLQRIIRKNHTDVLPISVQLYLNCSLTHCISL